METRRRKIVERGSDRLALITGRIHSLEEPSPSVNSSDQFDSSHLRTHSAPAAVPAGDFSFQDHDFQKSHLHGEGASGDALHQNKVANQDSNVVHDNKTQSSAIDTKIFNTTTQDEAQGTPKSVSISHCNGFTLKEVNSCVISSENTRVFCSIMIALLVVISYANLPRHIVKSKSIIASGPVYVLLATDIMIVFLRLRVIANQRSSKMAKEEVGSRLKEANGSDQWSEAIKLMEWGLVAYQILRALFIDCSFYTVIVVCGFSFI